MSSYLKYNTKVVNLVISSLEGYIEKAENQKSNENYYTHKENDAYFKIKRLKGTFS